jgi:hypothetical protein
MFSSIYFEIQKTSNRLAVEQKIKNKTVQFDKIFSFSKDEAINWTRDKKEISMNGKLYDVLHIKCKNEIIYISCVSDSNDDQIEWNFHKNKEHQKHKKNTPNSKKINLLNSIYKTELHVLIDVESEKLKSPFIPQHYSTPYKAVFYPPPIC